MYLGDRLSTRFTLIHYPSVLTFQRDTGSVAIVCNIATTTTTTATSYCPMLGLLTPAAAATVGNNRRRAVIMANNDAFYNQIHQIEHIHFANPRALAVRNRENESSESLAVGVGSSQGEDDPFLSSNTQNTPRPAHDESVTRVNSAAIHPLTLATIHDDYGIDPECYARLEARHRVEDDERCNHLLRHQYLIEQPNLDPAERRQQILRLQRERMSIARMRERNLRNDFDNWCSIQDDVAKWEVRKRQRDADEARELAAMRDLQQQRQSAYEIEGNQRLRALLRQRWNRVQEYSGTIRAASDANQSHFDPSRTKATSKI